MKKKRFSEEQIISVLREHEAGAKAGDCACGGYDGPGAGGVEEGARQNYGTDRIQKANIQRLIDQEYSVLLNSCRWGTIGSNNCRHFS